MGIFRMYTGVEGKSVIEELRLDDPILETLKTCTGCSLQVNAPSEFSHIPSHLVVESFSRSLISSRRDELQIEPPVSCR